MPITVASEALTLRDTDIAPRLGARLPRDAPEGVGATAPACPITELQGCLSQSWERGFGPARGRMQGLES